MSLIVPQITTWVSFSEHPGKGYECQLATVISEDCSFNSILCGLGNSPINSSIIFSQPHHTGQPPSRGVSECRSRQKSIRGKCLYHRGEHIWNGEFQWVLLLHQWWAAVLTMSGLSLLKALLHFWLWYLPFWKLSDMSPEKFWRFCPRPPRKVFLFSRDN